jgi:hypothetical protein
VPVEGMPEMDLNILKSDECYDSKKEYSMDISRHLAAPKVVAVPVSKPGSPVIEIRQNSDSRSGEDMLEYR